MAEDINLKEIELFAALTDKQVEQVSDLAEIETYAKDSKLFQVGDEAKDIYILLDGKVSIQVQLSSRPEKVDIVMLGQKGQLIGWSGLMGVSHYTASGICQADCKLLRINGPKFMEVLKADKEAGFDVLQEIITIISNRLRNLQSVVLKTM